MDLSDKLAGVRITQQLSHQADEKGAHEFFKPPPEVYESNDAKNDMNYEQYYDYETNSYLHGFKS